MILQPVLHPLLLLLLFAPVLALIVWVIVRPPRPAASAGAAASSPPNRAHRTLWSLRLVMVLACLVMLLRPGIPGGATQTLATDTDILLVVDTTASIVAEDWDDARPRLDGVREDVAALIQEYPGARFALVTFDAAAELRMPLTTDTTALVGSLGVLRPEVTSQSRGSSIGIAAPLVVETLAAAAEASPDRSRMVFYFGDGEQTVSSPPESFEESAKYTDAGAVFGYGTAEGGPMRITSGGVDPSGGSDEGYIEYQGSEALSTIDEANLQAVAEQLGITYELRTAETPPTLPEAPATTTSYAESGEVGNVIELYWIAALVIVALLGIELARATMLIARLRQLRAPGTPRPLSEQPRPLSERSETKGAPTAPTERTPRPLSERSETKGAPTAPTERGAP